MGQARSGNSLVLAQQDVTSQAGADALCVSAALSAQQQPEEWQLASGWLSKMAQAKRERIPPVAVHHTLRTSRLSTAPIVGSSGEWHYLHV